jgi:hypothetical protein
MGDLFIYSRTVFTFSHGQARKILSLLSLLEHIQILGMQRIPWNSKMSSCQEHILSIYNNLYNIYIHKHAQTFLHVKCTCKQIDAASTDVARLE